MPEQSLLDQWAEAARTAPTDPASVDYVWTLVHRAATRGLPAPERLHVEGDLLHVIYPERTFRFRMERQVRGDLSEHVHHQVEEWLCELASGDGLVRP